MGMHRITWPQMGPFIRREVGAMLEAADAMPASCAARVAGEAIPYRSTAQWMSTTVGSVIRGMTSTPDGEVVRERAPRRGPRRTLRAANHVGAALRPSAALPLVAEHARRWM